MYRGLGAVGAECSADYGTACFSTSGNSTAPRYCFASTFPFIGKTDAAGKCAVNSDPEDKLPLLLVGFLAFLGMRLITR